MFWQSAIYGHVNSTTTVHANKLLRDFFTSEDKACAHLSTGSSLSMCPNVSEELRTFMMLISLSLSQSVCLCLSIYNTLNVLFEVGLHNDA